MAIKSIAGKAALSFDPWNDDEIAASMISILTDTEVRNRLCEAGPQRAANYSWRTAAQQTLRVLEATAKS